MTFSSDVRLLWSWVKEQDWRAYLRNSLQPKYWGLWVFAVVVCAAGISISYYHDAVIKVVQEHAAQIRALPGSELIAGLLLVIWAIPPMLGHPALVVSYGLIWGLVKGSVISLAGGWLGELLVYFAVEAVFSERGRRVEQSSAFYAAIAIVLRHGGFMINTLLRVSFISGHITTILQALAGTPIWIFLLAQVVESPTQIALVYMGVVFGDAESTSRTFIISASVYAATMAFSGIALYFLWRMISTTFYKVEADMKKRRSGAEDEESAGESAAFDLPRRSKQPSRDSWDDIDNDIVQR